MLFPKDKVQHKSCRYETETDNLSLSQRSYHQTVGAKPLNEKPFHRIEYHIQRYDLAAKAAMMVVEPQQEKEKQETPDGFIEESRVITYTVYYLRPRKICWTSVSLLVEKVPPAAYGLSQRNNNSRKICGSDKALFVVSADKVPYQKTEDKSAVDCKAAASYIKYP